MPIRETSDEFDRLVRLRATPEIWAAIDRLAPADGKGASELSLQSQLRRQFPDDVVRSALTLRELRLRARAKFTRADAMWFGRVGLEQATSEPVARHKARRFDRPVVDACSGIGGDTLALAERCDVIAVDRNPAACLCTKWNAETYDVGKRVTALCADALDLQESSRLLHIDPDRRAEGKARTLRVEQMSPSLDELSTLMRRFAGGAIKLSPASNFMGKFPNSEIELISLDGECREATVWFGDLSGGAELSRATVLPSGTTLAGHPLDALADVGVVERYVYDPDPSVVRAGLVNQLAVELNMRRLDDAEEYLTSDALIESPFVRAFEIVADLPNNDRAIRDQFRASPFGQVEIKCRHLKIDADAVRRKLPLAGNEPGVLIFARVAGKSRALIARRAD